MSSGIQVAGVYVRDQDEALAFYVDKLGFRVHTDVRNGDFRWLWIQNLASLPSITMKVSYPFFETISAKIHD